MQEQRVIYVISVDDIYHTDERPFCYAAPDCCCHEDQESIAMVNTWVQQGLMTKEEATNFILGRTF